MNSFIEGFKKGLGISLAMLTVFGIVGMVYAVGFHPTSDVLPGEFQGDYSFNGSVNFSNANIDGLQGTGGKWSSNSQGIDYTDGYIGINTDNPQYHISINNNNTGINGGNHLVLYANNTEFLRSDGINNQLELVNDGGNVGLGTSSPTSKLTINQGGSGAWERALELDYDGTNEWQIVGDSINGQRLNIGYNENSVFALDTGGNSWINTGGNVGIGTANPSSKLTVTGTVQAPAIGEIGTVSGINQLNFKNKDDKDYDCTSDSGHSGRFFFDRSGHNGLPTLYVCSQGNMYVFTPKGQCDNTGGSLNCD